MNLEQHWISTRTKVHVYIWQHRSLSPNILHNLVFLIPSFNLITHKKKKITHINSSVTTSQVLHKTTTLFHIIHFVTLMDCCCFLEFPTIKVFSHEMQANNIHIQINPKHTLWEGFMATLETSKLFIIPLFVVTLALDLWPMQRLARLRAKREAWESHCMLLGV
jgi:hypothetical protein